MHIIYVFPGLSSNHEELAVFIESCRARFRVVVISYPQWWTRRLNRPDRTELIAHCRRQIEPATELDLVGYSFGGHLAFAVGAELAGSAHVTISMLDTSAEPYLGPGKPPELDGLTQRISYTCGNILWRAQFRFARFLIEGPNVFFRLAARFGGFSRRTVKAIQMNLNLATLRDMLNWMSELAAPIPVHIMLFRCTTQHWNMHRDLGWQRYAAIVEVINVPGNHDTIVNLPNATVVASKFQRAIMKSAMAD
jgi:thioesterase domain-containing protein